MKTSCPSCKKAIEILGQKFFQFSDPLRFTQCRWIKGMINKLMKALYDIGSQLLCLGNNIIVSLSYSFTNVFLIARLARSDPRNHFYKLSFRRLLKFQSISSYYDLEQVQTCLHMISRLTRNVTIVSNQIVGIQKKCRNIEE